MATTKRKATKAAALTKARDAWRAAREVWRAACEAAKGARAAGQSAMKRLARAEAAEFETRERYAGLLFGWRAVRVVDPLTGLPLKSKSKSSAKKEA